MDTISISTKIKDKDRVNGELTKEFKFSTEANFAKILLEFIQEGNVIRIKSFTCEDKNDEYICSAVIILKKTLDHKGKLSHRYCRRYKVLLKNNKIIIDKKLPIKHYDVVGDEKDVM